MVDGALTLFGRSIGTLAELWPAMLVGTLVVLLSTWLGWLLGRYRNLVVVRGLRWWVVHVILPLLRSRSWLRRAVTIFVNNCSILAILAVMGEWKGGAAVGASIMGLSLGIALHVLSRMDDEPLGSEPRTLRRQWLVNFGVAMNMLELPAIIVALGLAFGRHAASLSAGATWQTFAVLVAPALLLAAAGEALWIGECYGKSNPAHFDMPDSEDSHQSM